MEGRAGHEVAVLRIAAAAVRLLPMRIRFRASVFDQLAETNLVRAN